MSDQAALHNAIAGQIVRAIVEPVVAHGGSAVDILVLTESVLVGVTLVCVKLGGDEAMLDVMLVGARRRLAELRLGPVVTEGQE